MYFIRIKVITMSFIQYSLNSTNMTAVGHYWTVKLKLANSRWPQLKTCSKHITCFTGVSDQGLLFQGVHFAINYS